MRLRPGAGMVGFSFLAITALLGSTHCLLPSLGDLHGGSPVTTDAGIDRRDAADAADANVEAVEVVASEQRRPLSIAVDATTIHWVNGEASGAVLSCPKTSCPAPTVLADGEKSPYALSVTTGYVAWTARGNGRIRYLRRGADAGIQEMMLNPLLDAVGVILLNGRLIWMDANASTGGALGPCPFPAQTTCSRPFITYGLPPPLDALFANETDVYFATSEAILRCDTAGCPDQKNPTVLASGQASPHAIAFDGSELFWTNSGDGTVMKRPQGSGAPQAIASGLTKPWGMVVDAMSPWVYVTDVDGRSVYKVRKDGTARELVARDQGGPWGIALDTTHVFWTNSDDGRVMRAPR